ncbi:hypothetical protein AVEN_30328-1 [Araneus ventricosus]|uniref:Pre-C2HC domain-containing protein n=1 Tax=Araneus ventricosus TaxID=182803 RepID=A0A4Y2X5I7_ARAVE|nr:hypothetical protein AVEN_30328-1 [Araneus ventricosus]
MEEDGRSRSTLSSTPTGYNEQLINILSDRKISFLSDHKSESQSSRRSSSTPVSDATEAWVMSHYHYQPQRNKGQTCQEISRCETIIDKNQEYAGKCSEALRDMRLAGSNSAIINSKTNELNSYKKKVEESEAVLLSIGPCPVKRCPKHHETSMEEVMDTETGQYNENDPEFKIVSPKKAAKIQPELPKTPVKTANKYQELTNLPENNPQVPAINLKLDADYNLTLQEIHSMFPETENKLIKGFISIQPNSEENRQKIIDLLRKNNKEFVLSEAREDRPLKIVIKWLPINQDKEELKDILESKGFKIIRISQLKNYRQKTLYPYFLVDVAKKENHLNIYNVKTIKHLKVKVETYRKKNRVTICFKCSDFHHSAKNC